MSPSTRPRILVLLKGRVDVPLSFRRQHQDEPCMLSEQAQIECNWDRIQRHLLDPLRKIGRVHVVVHTDADPIELDPPVDEWITAEAASQWERVTSVLRSVGPTYDAYVIARPDLVWKMDVPIAFPSSAAVEVAFFESSSCTTNPLIKCHVNDVIFAFRQRALNRMMRIFDRMGQETAQGLFRRLAFNARLKVVPLIEGVFTAATNKAGDRPNPLYRLSGQHGVDLSRERQTQLPFERLSRPPKTHESELRSESLMLLLDERQAEGATVVTVGDLETAGVRTSVGNLYVRHPLNGNAYLIYLDDRWPRPRPRVSESISSESISSGSVSAAAIVGIVIGCIVALTATTTVVMYVSRYDARTPSESSPS